MPEAAESKHTVQLGWDDVPHLDEQTKRDLLQSMPPYLRDARSKGIPSLGTGAIYPIPLEEVTCKPFAIPAFWKRGYGFDVGWDRTAAIWGAEDPTDGTLYAYAEHYMGHQIPAVHVLAIKARGDWIMGAIDPSSRQRQVEAGRQLFVTYQTLGLHLVNAVTAVDEGLDEVWSRLATGRLRLFTTLANTQVEYRNYRREERGKDGRVVVVKKLDHLMDALRYLVMTWPSIARVKPPERRRNAAAGQAVDKRAGY